MRRSSSNLEGGIGDLAPNRAKARLAIFADDDAFERVLGVAVARSAMRLLD